MIRNTINAIEANIEVMSRKYSGLRTFDEDLQEFIDRYSQLLGILELTACKFTVLVPPRHVGSPFPGVPRETGCL